MKYTDSKNTNFANKTSIKMFSNEMKTVNNLMLYDNKLKADNDGWYENSWYMINIQESNLPTHKKY